MNSAMRAMQAKQAECGMMEPPLRERLLDQKAKLSQRIADLDAAISALDANPNFEQVMNVVGKVIF